MAILTCFKLHGPLGCVCFNCGFRGECTMLLFWNGPCLHVRIKGNNMLPFLILLLTPFCVTEKVCIELNEYKIYITINFTTIIDKPMNFVSCSAYELNCLLDCTFAKGNDSSWFNNSSGCLEATISPSGNNDHIDVKDHDINCTLYPCINMDILNLMDFLSINQVGLMKLFYIRDSCLPLFNQLSPHQDLKRSYIRKEKDMLHNIIKTSNLINHNFINLGMNVIKINEMDLNTTDPRVQVRAAQLLPQNESYIPEIWLPTYALIPEKKSSIGTVSYTWPDQFELEPVNISSTVIRIELPGKRVQHLNPSIEIVFKNVRHTAEENVTMFACHYFDEYEWIWKTDGCETHIGNLKNNIICSCNHTTAFAVLLIRVPIDSIHWEILSYISYIGCGLSAFFTALSIVTFLFSHNKMDHSISIHVSLSGALFLLNTTFLLTEWGATVKLDWVCVLVAAAMHYSLLCSFTWMALEAVHLYLMLIKVFNTNYKHYMLKLSLAGWGIPAIIVSVPLGVKKQDFYGITETAMADSNQTSAICWITDDSYFYALNLVFFTLIFMFNAGILMAVISSICKMKQVSRKVGRGAKGNLWKDPERFTESCKSGLTVLGLTCLMGTTWGLAFLGSGYINYPILYLFCIFNSTQGFFIFIWICLSTRKQQRRDREDKMASNLTKTSTTKSD